MDIPRNLSTNTNIRKYTNGSAIFFDAISMIYADIIEEHYIDKYPNTVFLCTPCYPFFSFHENMISKEMIKNYSNRIFCNFDHFTYESYTSNLFDWCRNVDIDEIWEWQIKIMDLYPDDLKRKVRFMPVRYVTSYEDCRIVKKNIEYLFVFAGNINERRYWILNQFSTNYIPYKILNGIKYREHIEEFEHAAFVLNIHGNDGSQQEQLRIHEFLCMDMPVITEISDVNYFGDIICEKTIDDISNLYYDYCEDNIIFPENIADKYKALTYSDRAFERYREMLLRYQRII